MITEKKNEFCLIVQIIENKMLLPLSGCCEKQMR